MSTIRGMPPSTLLFLLTLFLLPLALSRTRTAPVHAGTIPAPVLKWQYGGCYSSWCETGWYSSPAVADLDGDGGPEVIGAAYSLFALNGENGSLQWSTDPPGGRVWPGVVGAARDNGRDRGKATRHRSG